MISQGPASKQFVLALASIPRNQRANGSNGDNYKGSSVFWKLFNNIILVNESNLSDLQYGCKAKSSTDTSTMVIENTISD